MSDTVQAIKERLSIVDVVSPYVKLSKAGKYWKGLSPFNKEKTPSFYVSPDRGLYLCFSSGKGGDMFTFIEEMERVDFRGALKILAEKAGVPLTYEAPGARDRKEELYGALEAAREYYRAALSRHPSAISYLAGRGHSERTLEQWSIGYAPNEWTPLKDALVRKGFSEGVLEEAGLVKRAEKEEREKLNVGSTTARLYDRFRGRIMFPIKDASGRVIAFTGRIFEDDPAHPQAKYLNSPETPLFEKSRVLYGMDVAKAGIRSLNFAILVEGQVDLLMAHQAGYVNTAALSGTAFTEDHAALIKRHTDNFVIAFDGDRAGVNAAGRAAAIALRAGLNVKIAAMPPGEDPADLVKRDPEAWKRAIRDATHVVDFYLSYIVDSHYDPRRMRLEVARTVLPYVAEVTNEIDRAHFVGRVSEVASIPEDAVRAELAKLKTDARPGPDTGAPPAEPFLSRGGSLERLLWGIAEALESRGLPGATAVREAIGAEPGLSAEDERAAIIEGDLFLDRYDDAGERERAVAELVADVKKELARDQYRALVASLRSAERAGDTSKAASLMEALARLAKTL